MVTLLITPSYRVPPLSDHGLHRKLLFALVLSSLARRRRTVTRSLGASSDDSAQDGQGHAGISSTAGVTTVVFPIGREASQTTVITLCILEAVKVIERESKRADPLRKVR